MMINQNFLRPIIVFVLLSLFQHISMADQSTAYSQSPINRLITSNSLMVSNRFGPTLIHFDDLGHFLQFGRDGLGASGIWRTTDKSVCLTMTSIPPERTVKEHCLELIGREFGSTWTAEDPRNGTITYKLLEGHPQL